MINQSRRRITALAIVIVLMVALAQSMTLAQTPGEATVATSETEVQRPVWETPPAWAQSASHRMNDNFLYDVVDVGFGQMPGGLRRVWSGRRSSLAIRSSGPGFWLALRVTNLWPTPAARHLSRRPSAGVFISERVTAIDDAKNEYSVRRVTVKHALHTDVPDLASDCGFSDRGDYAPGAFSIELLYIPASELVGDIKELQVIVADSTDTIGLRTRRVFSIKTPRSVKRDFKNRDFDYRNPAVDVKNLPVEARTLTSQQQWDSAKGQWFWQWF